MLNSWKLSFDCRYCWYNNCELRPRWSFCSPSVSALCSVCLSIHNLCSPLLVTMSISDIDHPLTGLVFYSDTSIYTLLYHLLRSSSLRLRSNSRTLKAWNGPLHSGKPNRPAIILRVLNDCQDDSRISVLVCLMATFDGVDPAKLSSMHQHFIAPVFPNLGHSSYGGNIVIHPNHSCEEWPTNQWVVACPYRISISRRELDRRRTGHSFSRKSISQLSRICRRRYNDWTKMVRTDESFISRNISDLKVGLHVCILSLFMTIMVPLLLGLPNQAPQAST